jgi:hypothetical protein
MDLPIDTDQLSLIGKGYLISDVCPDLTTEQVEFLLYGILPGDIQKLNCIPNSGGKETTNYTEGDDNGKW